MVNPAIPEHLSLIYLVISLYTSFVEPSILKSLGSSRIKLKYWARSLQINAKLVPIAGILTIAFGFYDYFKLGNNYFLFGSLLLVLVPLFMGLVGKVPQRNRKLVRILSLIHI